MSLTEMIIDSKNAPPSVGAPPSKKEVENVLNMLKTISKKKKLKLKNKK